MLVLTFPNEFKVRTMSYITCGREFTSVFARLNSYITGQNLANRCYAVISCLFLPYFEVRDKKR